jgi:putative ABC transport system permease protein
MGTLLQDVRYGWRALVSRPGFTLIAILALALGIGANTAIFSVVHAVLLQRLPYGNPDQLVWIWESNPGSAITKEPTSLPNYVDWRAQNQSFTELTAWSRANLILTGDGEPERVPGSAVAANFFSTLGVSPALGRTFVAEENTPGKNRVAVLSHAFWQRRFGADPNIAGRTVTLNGNPYSIVGVMPAAFRHPDPGMTIVPDLWIPLSIDGAQNGRRGDFLRIVGRLKPGVNIEGATKDMTALTARLAEQYPAANAGWTVTLLTLHQRFTGDVRKPILLIMGAVAFLLLIACANVANLLLARAATREREIAIRSALGARRVRLLRQLLTESLLLALAGGLAGLLVAIWGVEALRSIAPENLPRLDSAGLNYLVLTFAIGLSLLTGIVFGIVPAMTSTSIDLNSSLKEGGRGTSDGKRGAMLRDLVAVAEIALALMLLVSSGLLIRSFLKLQKSDPGFKPENVATMQVLLPRNKYPEGPQISAFFDQLLERIKAMPGVDSAGAVDSVPLGGGGNVLSFLIEGNPAPPPEQVVDAEAYTVSPGYFGTLAIPFVRGRDFSERDDGKAPGVTIINEMMANRYFPGEDPLGKRITLGNAETGPWLTVVGIVKDVAHNDLGAAPYSQMYGAYRQNPSRLMSVVARTSGGERGAVAGLRDLVKSIDRDLPLGKVTTMEQLLSDSIARPRFNALLITIFAAAGLLLAAVGIYGVISYGVTQRVHEIGVRIALGASSRDVMGLVLSKGLKLAIAGVAIGLLLSLAAGRLLSTLLFGVGARDPLTFVGLSAVIVGVAMLACYLPARKAMKVDPMVALRYE